MSKKSLVPVNVLALDAAPSMGQLGDLYFNTVTNTLYAHDGTSWAVQYIDAEAVADLISGAAIASTDDLTEGTANKYYTDTRVGDYITNNNISLQGAQGLQGTTGTGFTFRGAYSSGSQYYVNHVVTYNGSSWVCIQTIDNVAPSESTWWTTFSAQGTQGTQGYSGVDGNSSSYYKYKADTNTTSGDPGTGGTLYWNNATQTSATVLVIDHLTNDGIDIDVFLALLKTGDTIIIQDASNSANYQTWTVNGAETTYPNNYITVPVTLEDSAGTGTTGFANNHNLIVVIVATGVQGPTGAQGIQGLQGTVGETGPSDFTMVIMGAY